METSIKLGLHNQEGSLNLFVMECNCHMNDISIDLNGGASWLYQGYVDYVKSNRKIFNFKIDIIDFPFISIINFHYLIGLWMLLKSQ